MFNETAMPRSRQAMLKVFSSYSDVLTEHLMKLVISKGESVEAAHWCKEIHEWMAKLSRFCELKSGRHLNPDEIYKELFYGTNLVALLAYSRALQDLMPEFVKTQDDFKRFAEGLDFQKSFRRCSELIHELSTKGFVDLKSEFGPSFFN